MMFRSSCYVIDVEDHQYASENPGELIEIGDPRTLGEYGRLWEVVDEMSKLSGVNLEHLK
jgi:hypothetical protein